MKCLGIHFSSMNKKAHSDSGLELLLEKQLNQGKNLFITFTVLGMTENKRPSAA